MDKGTSFEILMFLLVGNDVLLNTVYILSNKKLEYDELPRTVYKKQQSWPVKSSVMIFRISPKVRTGYPSGRKHRRSQ